SVGVGLLLVSHGWLADAATSSSPTALASHAQPLARSGPPMGEAAPGRTGVPRRATVAALVALAAASVFTYSLPGLVWFALALPIWLGLELIAGRRPIDFAAARAAVARHRWAALIAAAVVIAVVVVGVGPAASFVSKIGKVQASAGRLSSPLSPGEALGLWPE